MKKIKVLTNGYFRTNFGDDLFFKIITEKYPNVDFYADVYLGFYSKLLKDKNNFHIPKAVNILNSFISPILYAIQNEKKYKLVLKYIWPVYRRLNRSFNENFDFKVSLVGSTFIEDYYKNVEADYKPLDLNKCKINNQDYTLQLKIIPEFLIGANVGPVYSEEFLDDIKCMLEGYNDVCFRDKASYNLYSFMDNVRYAPDVIFNLDISPYDIKNKKEIVFSLIDFERDDLKILDTDIAFESIAKIIEQYIDKGFLVNLVSFCKCEGDEFALRKTAKKIRGKYKGKYKLYGYDGKNTDNILRLFAECSYVVAGRFHSMILSMLFKKPFAPICYSDKMFNYLNDIGFKGEIINIRNLDKIDFQTINYNFENNIVVDVKEHIENAPQQFLVLDKYIKSSEV